VLGIKIASLYGRCEMNISIFINNLKEADAIAENLERRRETTPKKIRNLLTMKKKNCIKKEPGCK